MMDGTSPAPPPIIAPPRHNSGDPRLLMLQQQKQQQEEDEGMRSNPPTHTIVRSCVILLHIAPNIRGQ